MNNLPAPRPPSRKGDQAFPGLRKTTVVINFITAGINFATALFMTWLELGGGF